MVMTKCKKLYPDKIQEIRDFVITYKDLMTFTMAYKNCLIQN
jgi:hypothetical protein